LSWPLLDGVHLLQRAIESAFSSGSPLVYTRASIDFEPKERFL
jgi:hypothetical protein